MSCILRLSRAYTFVLAIGFLVEQLNRHEQTALLKSSMISFEQFSFKKTFFFQ